MKKIILALALMIGSLVSMAQTNNLESILKKSNEPLPTTVTDGMVLNSITNTDSGIVFDYTLADGVFANLKSMQDILRDAMVAEIVSSPDPLYKSLVSICKNSNINIVQKFTNSKGETIQLLITPEDIN